MNHPENLYWYGYSEKTKQSNCTPFKDKVL